MLLLLFIIFLIGLIIAIRNDYEGLEIPSGIGLFITILFLIICTVNLVDGKTVNDKIIMYTEENTKIEQQVDAVVCNYMDFESTTYKDLKNTSDIILLTSLYPELKSDELIKSQIQVYLNNNNEIKLLKNQLIDLKIYKWWLYFGG